MSFIINQLIKYNISVLEENVTQDQIGIMGIMGTRHLIVFAAY